MLERNPINQSILSNGVEYIYPITDFFYTDVSERNVLNTTALVNQNPNGVRFNIPSFIDANITRMKTVFITDLVMYLLAIDSNDEGYKLPVKELAWGDIYSPGSSYDFSVDGQYKGLSFTKKLNSQAITGSVSKLEAVLGLSIMYIADYSPFIPNPIFVPDTSQSNWQIQAKLLMKIQQIVI